MINKNPIGIFDSGVGGLSIAHTIRELLPSENLLYASDHQFSPYGNKSKQTIEDRSEYIANFLYQRKCKAIVVACNTATTNSIVRLRTKFNIPIVGVEPGIKPAAFQSNTGVIGILATEQTIKSQSFKILKDRFSGQVKIETQTCPLFVELVEEGDLNSKEAVKAVNNYILPLLLKGADHIVLGCTHYSFLIPIIEQTVRGKAAIVDTAKPVAEELKKRLTNINLLNPLYNDGNVEFWSSDTSKSISETVKKLWGQDVNLLKL